VNKLIILIFAILFLNNCSFNKDLNNSKDNEQLKDSSIKKLFDEKKIFSQEFNPELELDLTNIQIRKNIIENKNNYGFQNYEGLFNKIANYKFSKLENINDINYKPLFLSDGIIFFDKKGSILRYNEEGKVIWKKNYYSKSEKKLKPKLNFLNDNGNLIVTDDIAKYYSIDINTGELNWSKNSKYPFNSEIKKNKNKFFVVDYNNTLRCYYLNDGSECWNLQTQESFTISSLKYSLIIINDLIIFTNSIGDVTAVNAETGLIIWQLPTQSSSIINEAYSFKISKLVSDDNSIYFSNNKNQFYSIETKTGSVNWINDINSYILPIINDNLIFTISNEGYLFVIEKNNGNIIRITDLFKDYKTKKRKNIKPIGFVIGNTNLYLTNSDGKMVIVDLKLGNVINIIKVSKNLTSQPFLFNNNLYVIRNGSIIQYD
jgi:outer membrane protein assembly factor BamB